MHPDLRELLNKSQSIADCRELLVILNQRLTEDVVPTPAQIAEAIAEYKQEKKKVQKATEPPTEAPTPIAEHEPTP